jgi:hypothetical protein
VMRFLQSIVWILDPLGTGIDHEGLSGQYILRKNTSCCEEGRCHNIHATPKTPAVLQPHHASGICFASSYLIFCRYDPISTKQ